MEKEQKPLTNLIALSDSALVMPTSSVKKDFTLSLVSLSLASASFAFYSFYFGA